MSAQIEASNTDHLCVHELFELHAARAPEADAVIEEAQHWSYKVVNERANRLARHLRQQGVGPDVRVGILMYRSVDLVVAILATWKAGGAYVPLDPGLPAQRLRTMLETSVPPVILTHAPVVAEGLPTPARGFLDERKTALIDIDAGATAWADASQDNLPRAESGLIDQHLAYVIYTSGSTGRPKGVMVEHRGLVNLVRNQLQGFRIDPQSRVLQFAPFGFDASVSELGMALGGGAALCIAHHETVLVGVSLIEAIRRFGVTHLTAPPSVLGELPRETRFDSLVTLSLAGEAPGDALVRHWAKHHRLLNGYGPTEATVCSSVHEYTVEGERAATIGRPLQNTHIYILDEHGQPVPTGGTGEIHIGGRGVARGYENRPDLTAERFVPNPFTCLRGARMYKTGDLARYQADGSIEYIGRNDRQIKLRGFRIELAEIEAALLEHPRVLQAAVLVRQLRQGEQGLVAYVVEHRAGDAVDQDGTSLAKQLRRDLAEVLPDYMVPTAYVQLERMPVNANGKIDRAGLPDQLPANAASHRYETPQGAAEATLAQIWGDVLGIADVGRHDNFFELGGNSLLAVRVIYRMLQHGLHTDVRGIYLRPTIAALAPAIGHMADAVHVPENRIDPRADRITPEMLTLVTLTAAEIERLVSSVAGGARNVQDIYPLAPLQQGLLYQHRISTAGDSYRLWTMYRFQSRAQVASYVAALQAVVDRHDILRTAVMWEQVREPVQVVWRSAPLSVVELEIGAAGGSVAQALVERFNRGEFPLSLQHAPLVRLIVAAEPLTGSVIVMEISHHMIMDHVSQGLVQNELRARLLNLDEPAPAVPFRDFIVRARHGAARVEQEAFFTALLGAVKEPTAPFDILNVRDDGAAIAEAEQEIEPHFAARLRRAAQGAGVSPAALHHLAWGLVLSRLTGRGEVVFGTVLAGRSHGGAKAQRVIGLCANTLPIRLTVDGRSCRDAVGSTHQLLTELMAHEQASLALAQRCSGVAAPAPLFTTILNYRYREPELAGLGVARQHAVTDVLPGAQWLGAVERTNFPFAVSVDDWGSQLRLKVQVDDRVDPARMCTWMAAALQRLVEALETGSDTSLRGVDVMPEAERQLLLTTWNKTSSQFERDVCLHELFEASAARSPEAQALVHNGESLSFGRLNERANQLAGHLREQGVGPERRVALCMERGFDMVVGMLAILKAGGCYVPLDPAYPADRLEYMLRDAEPAVVITHQKVQDRVSTRLYKVAKERALPLIDLDTDKALWADRAGGNHARGTTGLDATHLAYVIYTSGSTGAPKGIEVEHRGAAHFVQWGMTEFGPEDLRQTLFSTSVNFDPSVLECFSALATGGTAIIVGDVLSGAGAGQKATLLNAVPSAMRALFDAGGIPATTRTVVLGGEALHPPLVERVFRESNAERVFNAYGPTETGYSTYAVTKRGEAFTGHIGRPLGHTRLYILDGNGNPTPIGIPGEIFIGGHGVARGYHQRPALTAERFVPDIFSAEAGARMYKTGDLARYRDDGTIEFIGRSDFQVKHRGFRIELGEIEAKILEHPAIDQAVVLLREDQPGDNRLVAYVVGKAGAAAADGAWPADVLRSHLSHFLTNHMVPAVYVALDSMPTTPNGKLDRAALPQPDAFARNLETYEAPVGGTEAQIAGIWMDLLSVGRVGRRDNFFELGGHSLLAMVVAARLRSGMGVEIPLSDLLAHPVLCDLAAEVGRVARSLQTANVA
ncbi:amino acid adenylation domain-containing protein [Duganella sp. 1411]|uniref:non-ribosomal peptide synthetase n=1 Tax=Duganella sp. 1411 TaxID=2806572 RepID=UPI001AE8FDB1|nr:non-ribosomal peptide synthetase [Duganella sp. 1411]MBP1207089.1 amino acid adenylation domain-containing protein [Duganella sp. 1411]